MNIDSKLVSVGVILVIVVAIVWLLQHTDVLDVLLGLSAKG